MNVFTHALNFKWKITYLPPGFPFSPANFDDFPLLFCRGRLGNALNFETHVLSHCSVHLIFCFGTSLFPSQSWSAKDP